MPDIDIAIIGAGVVGLAIAYELSEDLDNIYLFEKNERYGLETSSRNSGVIHSGIYYPPKTLKSKLCLEGSRLLYEFCHENSIPHKKIGKIIVATNESDKINLIDLYKHGQELGVEGLELIDKTTLSNLEPNVKGICGILSNNTGIVDVHRLMDKLYQLSKARDVSFLFKMMLSKIKKIDDGFEITFDNKETTTTRYLINSAGLYSDKIAEMAGIDDEQYQLRFVKGSYFYYAKKSPVTRLIYPIPHADLEGLGIHATLDLDNRLRFGPDTEPVDEINYQIDISKKEVFYQMASRLINGLDKEYLCPDTTGIRPKLIGSGFKDFIIQEEKDRGLNGMINLIGIESPGLTCCLAIGRYVKNLIKYQEK
ncbi:MAG: NAD(P)/FAD-dependent oxidoreductase [Thermodesulfovibrionales bacterium]|nr:NAD(P)/FAD-dependent oxidoreductase [Thermodesulfovibrionales bacterium]